jgi:hypothetical protein
MVSPRGGRQTRFREEIEKRRETMDLVCVQTQPRLLSLCAAGCGAWLALTATTSAASVRVTGEMSKKIFEATPPGGAAPAGPGEFESGFEPPCFLGFIGGGGSGEPQNCDWHASAAAFPGMEQPEIEDDNPLTGAQHLHFEYDPNQASGSPDLTADPDSRNWAFSDDIVPTPTEGVAHLKLDLFISAHDGLNSYIIQVQAPTQMLLTTVMIFNADGSITVGDDDTCDDDTFTLVTISKTSGDPLWTAGEYVQVDICLDVPNNRIRYFYGGELLYSTDPDEGGLGCGLFAGTIIEHVLIRYEGNLDDGTTMDVDDVVIEEDNCPGEAPDCPEDISGDGSVGFADLLAVLNAWGPCPGCPEDISGDGSVGFADLLSVLNAWGPCP